MSWRLKDTFLLTLIYVCVIFLLATSENTAKNEVIGVGVGGKGGVQLGGAKYVVDAKDDDTAPTAKTATGALV